MRDTRLKDAIEAARTTFALPDAEANGQEMRAAIVLRIPGSSQTLVEELDGCCDPQLRYAIEMARRAFWDVYEQPAGLIPNER